MPEKKPDEESDGEYYESESMSGGEDSDPEHLIAEFRWCKLCIRLSQFEDPIKFLSCYEMLKGLVENELRDAEESDEEEARTTRKRKGFSQIGARMTRVGDGDQIRIALKDSVCFKLEEFDMARLQKSGTDFSLQFKLEEVRGKKSKGKSKGETASLCAIYVQDV